MHKKLYTRAMSFFLAVLMSFTLLMPETFANNSSNNYDDSCEECQDAGNSLSPVYGEGTYEPSGNRVVYGLLADGDEAFVKEDNVVTLSYTDGGQKTTDSITLTNNNITITITTHYISTGSGDGSDCLTGDIATVSVGISTENAYEIEHETARVYMQMSDTDAVTTITGMAGTYYTSDGIPWLEIEVTEVNAGFYCLELHILREGETAELNYTVYYPSPSSDGGSMQVFGEILTDEDDAESKEPKKSDGYTYNEVTWGTVPSVPSVTKSYSSATFSGDGTDDGKIFLNSLKYTVKASLSAVYSDGKDYYTRLDFSDYFELPDELVWSVDIVSAIENSDYRVSYSNSSYRYMYPATVYVTVDGIEYILCTIQNSTSNDTNSHMDDTTPLEVVYVTDDYGVEHTYVVLNWYTTNSSSSSSEISLRTFTITFGDQIIEVADPTNIPDDSKYTVTNSVLLNSTTGYHGVQDPVDATLTKDITLNDGSLTINKYVGSATSSSSSSYYTTMYMGRSYKYYITYKNPDAGPYYDLRYLDDQLTRYVYIQSDDMETMFSEDTGHQLTITLTNASLYTPVYETVTRMDGTEATVTQEQESASHYSGLYTGTDGNLITSSATITFCWQGDVLTMTIEDGEDMNGMYTIGSDQDFNSIQDALDYIGYAVSYSVLYNITWDLGEDYVLYGGQTITISYLATVKDTFAFLLGDRENYYVSSYITSSYTNTNTVYARNDTGTSLKSSYAQGRYFYRDFGITKSVSDSTNSGLYYNGDVLDYTITVSHYYTGQINYEAMPIADSLGSGQTLMVPVTYNENLASYGLTIYTTSDGTEYYLLNQSGTYYNVYLNSTQLADHIVVTASSSHVSNTKIYCYYYQSGSSTSSTKLTYKALIALSGDDFDSNQTYSISNDVYLNDHETNRLHDDVGLAQDTASVEKNIVEDYGDDLDNPNDDSCTKHSTLSEGTAVTYLIKGTETSYRAGLQRTVTGSDLWDVLPETIKNYPWSKDNVSIKFVAASDLEITGQTIQDAMDAWSDPDNWYISNENLHSDVIGKTDNTQYFIYWNDNISMTFSGSFYIYITLQFPENIDVWYDYADAYINGVENTIHFLQYYDTVSHDIQVTSNAYLMKGVYSTGLRQDGRTSTSYYYQGNSDDSLFMYANDGSTYRGIVRYYTVIYNEGPNDLYLNTIQDELPAGFTLYTSYSPSVLTTSSALKAADGTTISPKSCSISYSTTTNSDGRQVISFNLSTTSTSSSYIHYDETHNKYYISPGEAVAISYYVSTNGYANSDDIATNMVTMPFYDYTGGGVETTDKITTSYVTSKTQNEGDCIISDVDTITDLGFNSSSNEKYWLFSDVTLIREEIAPDIVKTAEESFVDDKADVNWDITATNNGGSTMYDYTITDVMEYPYTFNGEVFYTVSPGSNYRTSTYRIGYSSYNYHLFNITGQTDSAVTIQYYGPSSASGTSRSNRTATVSLDGTPTPIYVYVSGDPYSSVTTTVYVSFYFDDDGNQIMQLEFSDWVTALQPYGGYGKLVITTSPDTSIHTNAAYYNTAYITPTQTFSRYSVDTGVYVDSDEYVSSPSVKDSAQIFTSYGYYTTSEKTVTELNSDGTSTTNSASSFDGTPRIALTDLTTNFRYTLTITNGSEASRNPDMTKLVVIDNLPEQNDKDAFGTSERESEFSVSFADDPDFTLWIESVSGTLNTLEENRDYVIQYSNKTTFTSNDWSDLNYTDGWYDNIEDVPNEARSFRILFNFSDDSFTYIPMAATVYIAYDCQITYPSTVEPSEIAWNSFGYHYSVGGGELESAPAKVGIQAPSAPVLYKELQYDNGQTAYATENMTFDYVLVKGGTSKYNISDTKATDELLAELRNQIGTDFEYLTFSLTVPAGSSESNVLQLYGLTGKSYDTQTSSNWEWEDSQTYSVYEVINPERYDYDFGSWNVATHSDCYEFTYSRNTTQILINYNETHWVPTVEFELQKTDRSGNVLSGAEFTLTNSEGDLIHFTPVNNVYNVYDGDESEGTTTVITAGNVIISGLSPDRYILIETKTPDGYENITGQVTIDVNEDGNITCENADMATTGDGETIIAVKNYELTEVIVNKEWSDSDNQDGVRPDSIEVVLTGSDGNIYYGTLTADSGWTYTFTDIPKYIAEDVLVEYSVQEVSTTQYTDEVVKGSDGYTFTITNTYIPAVIDIPVNKSWNDDSNRDGIRPESIAITLTGSDGKAYTAVLNEENGFSYLFEGLPVYYNAGTEIIYTLTEEPVDGYSASISKDGYSFTVLNTHTPEVTSIKVDKAWIDNNNQDGIRPDYVIVMLSGSDGSSYFATVSVEGNWTYTFTNLLKYEDGEEIVYTISEFIPEGYSESTSGDMEDGYVITNTHEPKTTNVAVTKVWDDNNNQDGMRPSNVTVTLTGSNGYVGTAQLTSNNGYYYVFSDLDMYDNGELISYILTEASVDEYSASIAKSNDGYTFTVLNSHKVETTSIPVEKHWDDGNDQDGLRPSSITAILTGSDGSIYEAILNESNGWYYVFTNIPIHYNDGEEIIYSMHEEYVYGYSNEIDGSADEGFNILNIHNPETTGISIVKVWDDDNNRDGLRPEDGITFTLYADGKKVESNTVTASDGWSWHISDLPVYDNGEKIEYSIAEDKVTGYEDAVIAESADGYTFTVTNSHTPETMDIPVQKDWDDGSNQDGVRPNDITVILSGTDGSVHEAVLSESNEWAYTFTDLPVNCDGKEIVYSLHEEYVYGYTELVTGDAESGFVVTNTHIPATTNVSVTKTWNDNNDQDGIRPSSVEVTLTGTAEDYSVTYTGTLTSTNSYYYVFEDLPMYNDGNLIRYTLAEADVDGYTAQIVKGADGYTFTVTNMHTPETVSVTISKAWDDDDDRDGIRPSHLTVILVGDNNISYTGILNASNEWSYTFKNLPKYNDGELVNYYADELTTVSGYKEEEVEFEEDSDGNYTFTLNNSHTPETVSISGLKTWDDHDNQDGIRPNEITVNLYADGEPALNKNGDLITTTATASNGWYYTFDNLTKYRDGGIEIVYTVTEDPIEDYDSAVSGTNIFNSHTPYTVDIPVQKIWDDNDDQDGIRTKTITVYLSGSDGNIYVADLTAENDWYYVFEDLPLRHNGVDITYSLHEAAVDGYTAEVVAGTGNHSFTVTNTYVPAVIDIPVAKVWDDNENQDGIRPNSISVTLTGSDGSTYTARLTESNGYMAMFTDLPVYYDHGMLIDYTLVESTVDEYEGTVTKDDSGYAFTVENSHELYMTDVTVEKTWDDGDNRDGIRPDSVDVTLTGSDGNIYTAVLTAEDNWTYTFTDLPVNYAEGTTIVYELTEASVGGYAASISKSSDSYTFTVENTHEPELRKIPVTKIWADNDDELSYRPSEIEVTLTGVADGKTVYEKTVALTKGNDWNYMFEDLFVYENGQTITYTVSESAIDDYYADITGSMRSGYEITNTVVAPQLTKELAEDDYARKENDGTDMHEGEDTDGNGFGTWDDADNNQEITFHLTLTDIKNAVNLTVHDYLESGLDFEFDTVDVVLYDDENETVLKNGSDYAVTEGECSDPDCIMAGCTFEVKFEDSVFEDISPDAYIIVTYKTLTDTHADDYDNFVDELHNQAYILYGASTFMHRSAIYATETDLFGFEAYKYSNENGELISLENAGFILSKDNSYAQFTTETGTDDNTYYMISGWTNNEDNADVLFSGTDGIIRVEGLDDDTYTLTEVAAPTGYYKLEGSVTFTIHEDGTVTGETIIDVNDDVFVGVENEQILTSVTVTKTWDDADNQDGIRPDAIVVHLYADGEMIDSAIITEENDWAYTFEDLVAYNNGIEIVYTVSEDEVDEYTTAIDGTEIINTHVPYTVNVSVQKAWDDDNDRDAIRPDTVTVTLTGSDGSTYTAEVTEKDDWTYVFEDIPQYSDGVLIDYTLTEADVNGYSAAIEKNGDGYTFEIVNTHESELITVSGTKTWVDNDNQDGIRPNEITVRLYADGEEIESTTATSATGWNYSFANLYKYRDNGVEIVYTVAEDDVNGYTVEYSNYDITNTHKVGSMSIDVTKTWDDGNNADGIRPDYVTVILTADGQMTGYYLELTESNGWTGTFKNLDVYADGNAIEYGIYEVDVDGYTSATSGNAEDGFVLTNTHVVTGKETTGDNGGNNTTPDDSEPTAVEMKSNGGTTNNNDTFSNDTTTTTPAKTGEIIGLSVLGLALLGSSAVIIRTVARKKKENEN